MSFVCLNPFPNKPWFLRVCSTSFLITLWKKEKFLPFQRTFCHFHQIKNFCLQSFLVWKSLYFVAWERVNMCLIYLHVSLSHDSINPLPDNKILDWSKLKAFADNKLTHSHTMTPFDAPGKQAF